jgi:hypothetical protein
MHTHPNARLTPLGLERLLRRYFEEHLPLPTDITATRSDMYDAKLPAACLELSSNTVVVLNPARPAVESDDLHCLLILSCVSNPEDRQRKRTQDTHVGLPSISKARCVGSVPHFERYLL